MRWQIQWSSQAIRDIKKLDEPIKKSIWDSLDNLIKQPKSADINRIELTNNPF